MLFVREDSKKKINTGSSHSKSLYKKKKISDIREFGQLGIRTSDNSEKWEFEQIEVWANGM